MKFEEGDVVVQGLRIVIVMDVGGGHPQGLGSGAAELLGEVVVSNADVDGVSRANNAEI